MTNEQAQRIFCGKGKSIFNGQGLKLSLCLDQIPEEFIWTGNDDKRRTTICVAEKRGGVDQYGNTHNAWVDTWRPNNNE